MSGSDITTTRTEMMSLKPKSTGEHEEDGNNEVLCSREVTNM
jgi:hypothetical protein